MDLSRRQTYIGGLIGVSLLTVTLRLRGLFDMFSRGRLLRGVDSYYHLRQTRAMMVDPYFVGSGFDVYTGFPAGNYAPQFGTLFDGLVAAGSILLPLSTEITLALSPLVFAVLTVLVVAYLGYEISGQATGFAAATLLAVFPGVFYARTLFGFGDHHAPEAFFFMLLIYATVRTIRSDSLFWGVGAILSAMLYYNVWSFGKYFIMALAGFFLLGMILDKSYPTINGYPTQLQALAGYFLTAGVGVLSILTVGPSLGLLFGRNTVSEMVGWFSYYSMAGLTPLHGISFTYGLASLLAMFGAIAFLYRDISHSLRAVLLGMFGLFAVFGVLQIRFQYYLDPFVALFAGYALARIYDTVPRKRFAVVALVLTATIALPLANLDTGVSDDYETIEPTLAYLETHSEPINLPYNEHREPRENYDYPIGSYGILTWWDYGHYITERQRIPVANPHQQHARGVARYFTAQNQSQADRWLAKLEEDDAKVRYIIISDSMLNGSRYDSMERTIRADVNTSYESSQLYRLNNTPRKTDFSKVRTTENATLLVRNMTNI